MSESLFIDLEGRTRFAPGETVAVAVAWELDRPPAWLELALIWQTAGRGTTDRAAAFRRRWAPNVGPEGGAAGAEVLDAVMPPGPWSYDGRLVGVQWAFELTADGGPETARAAVFLRPPGYEAVDLPPDSVDDDD